MLISRSDMDQINFSKSKNGKSLFYNFHKFPTIYIFCIKNYMTFFLILSCSFVCRYLLFIRNSYWPFNQNSYHKNIFYDHINLFWVLFGMSIIVKKSLLQLAYIFKFTAALFHVSFSFHPSLYFVIFPLLRI